MINDQDSGFTSVTSDLIKKKNVVRIIKSNTPHPKTNPPSFVNMNINPC